MRIPVSAPQNVFFNSQNISDSELTLEQNYNNQIQASIKDTHFGSGVLPDALTQHVLFDSASAQGFLDGKAISSQAQPSDSNNGNQLDVELTNSNAAGKRTVKILIIGLDFQNNLQYDRFTFNRNEKQISSKHYRTILAIFLNDFFGAPAQSFNLGGRITIKETSPMSLSRDCVMVAQDVEPNLFFRDFFVSTNTTLARTLQAALPSYNLDNLNIKISYKQLISLIENDVSSQVGQKFLVDTNNIQKITLLMSVINNTTPSDLVWTGDLLVSIYQLQSTVSCPTDISPQLAIEFDPSNIPLAQLSVDYNSLFNSGTTLNTVPQSVDFIFSNTPVGSGLVISPGNYYAISVKRAGSADTCQIQFATGTNSSSTTRETLFNGSIWTDIPEESLWFQVWTDAAKVSDGQAYDVGHGVVIPKSQIDPVSGLTVDYSLSQIQFTRNDIYYALMQAKTQDSVPVQDERTGSNVLTQQEFVPSVSLLNQLALSNIQSVSEPLILGTITDQNVKVFNSASPTISAAFHEYGMVDNQLVLKVITDSSDGYRYDQNVIELVSELVNGNLNGAKIFPNAANPSIYYRIANAELLTMIYGDTDGNGIVDQDDLMLANQYINADINSIPLYNQYVNQTTVFAADGYLHWQVVDANSNVVASGADGTLTPNPSNGAQANFFSMSANFNAITNIGSDKLVITNSVAPNANNGSFTVIDLVDNNNLTIRKLFYTSDTILQIMRSDINGDMILDGYDLQYITNYITASPPFPNTTSPANRVGTTFNAIRLTLEKYIDRADDYPSINSNRNATVHTIPDIYLDGYTFTPTFQGQNLKTTPLTFTITKQLIWTQSSVVSNSNPRLISVAFNYQSGYDVNSCNVQGTLSQSFPLPPNFDPGRNDIFMPNNVVMNYGGEFVRPDGYFMKMDFEVGTILIEVPDIPFDSEHTINLLTDFIANFSGTGYTLLGYPAMKFADCSNVSMDALTLNQIRFAASVQSFSPQLNGVDPNCIDGIIVDGKIGVSINYQTGFLTLNFTNLYQDPVKQTLNTKIQITVYLKKAGWNNQPILVNSIKAQNIFQVPNPVIPDTNCPDPSIVIIS